MESNQSEGGRPSNIAIIGVTGSIGRQTADIIKAHPEMFKATVLTAGSRVDDLISLSIQLRPALAIIAYEDLYPLLKEALAPYGIQTACGAQALEDAMRREDIDMVVTATVGYSGLAPTLAAIESGKDIALANKETLVVAGELVTRKLAQSPSKVYPVDSEHSAIFQCLVGEDHGDISRLLITASGGPFRKFTLEQLKHVTCADALNHPNWVMGKKITIDSSTMLNKAFEIIEARWLFDVQPDKIEAVVHPQSIVHSMVEFEDGAIKAQLGAPDMHLPIAYALCRGKRLPKVERQLTVKDFANLTFEEPDLNRFPCLGLAQVALNRGGNTACVINAANEIAVDAFLHERIGYMDIYRIIVDTLDHISFIPNPTYNDYVETNHQARAYAESLIGK